ncbi:MAG TPA: plastocyanin/azurin family copper-binding protein [Actinomycetota bacterium]|nr:plastocyanin/azurin family copper-binding protein [Actinomycetota bacterium]
MTRRGIALLAAVAVAAAGGCSGRTGETTTVELTMRHSRFDPEVIEAEPGQAIRFVVRNLDPIDHELIVGPPAVQRRHEDGREGHHHGTIPGEVTVPAGTVRATTYTVGRSGEVPFGCHLPGHWAYGMRGVVRVG